MIHRQSLAKRKGPPSTHTPCLIVSCARTRFGRRLNNPEHWSHSLRYRVFFSTPLNPTSCLFTPDCRQPPLLPLRQTRTLCMHIIASVSTILRLLLLLLAEFFFLLFNSYREPPWQEERRKKKTPHKTAYWKLTMVYVGVGSVRKETVWHKLISMDVANVCMYASLRASGTHIPQVVCIRNDQ